MFICRRENDAYLKVQNSSYPLGEKMKNTP